MTMFPSVYLILGILVFGMNVVPAFMPPTWMVLFFFYWKYRLDLIAVVAIGAATATLGRVVLALLAQHYARPHLSKDSAKHLDILGAYVNKHTHISVPLMLTYAFLPVPSNQVYIAAGLAKVNIKIMALSFLLGRLFSYAVWVSTSHRVATSLEKLFSRYYSKTNVFLIELLGFFMLYLFTRIKWGKLLRKYL